MSMEISYPSSGLEIWGGIECTINRVGNTYRDQLAELGHYQRQGDIDLFAKLGIKKLRYPVLWEKHMPDESCSIDWRGTGTRLEELRNQGIAPIAGLLHHGSGPSYTDLLDESFADKLAEYAGRVARQFPWLEFYTPVNEPLTTARFSGLYGFWYPHRLDERSFILMLLNQLKGIILSMQAIRQINPAAKLIQTEDLCKIHSTPLLAYQAAFENERRWLTYDLLCGKFKPEHPLWNHFLGLNIPEKMLHFFTEHSHPPEIIGFNYYITSERYLDEDLEKYPAHQIGGNGWHRYADTDAARRNERYGVGPLLQEAWERYNLPMAITECHLNCSREEQMRWLKEIWDDCSQLREQNVPVKAVTAWALLGSYDWDSLLLHHNERYEPGVFDIGGGKPRATILSRMIRAFAHGKSFRHPLLEIEGWWHHRQNKHMAMEKTRTLLTLSRDLSLANTFKKICAERHIVHKTFVVSSLQWDEEAISSYIKNRDPWCIVLLCRENESQNAPIYQWADKRCRDHGIPLLLISTFSVRIYQRMSTEQKRNTLLIQNENPDNPAFAQRALDLFIDGEKGLWQLDENCTRKILLQESEYFG